MYKRLLCTSALILGMAAAALPAAGAEQGISCGARHEVVASLRAKYGETRRGRGLAGSTAVIELYASEKTGSWTILLTDSRGLSCIMAVGEGWERDTVAAPAEGDPA
jgi:hypothetical protein